MPFPREAPSKHSLNAPGNQRTMPPEGKLAPTGPPPTAERCLQTIRVLAGQLTVYTDGSATAGTKGGGAGVIVTCGDPADWNGPLPTTPATRPILLSSTGVTFAARKRRLPCNSHWNGPLPTQSPLEHKECRLELILRCRRRSNRAILDSPFVTRR